ncbi:immunoglobulin iota chain-like [Astyanax mexicanus]|nr:immunoglobulin iota chain-like [Astyanax mexicanus]
MMFLCSLTVFIIILGNCSAQSINPVNETQLHALKDETVTISYKYEGANTLLTIVPTKGAKSDPNPLFPQFSSTVDFSESRVNLIISSTAVSDSALYYCALQPTVTETHQTLY